jgi:hypothetical protein
VTEWQLAEHYGDGGREGGGKVRRETPNGEREGNVLAEGGKRREGNLLCPQNLLCGGPQNLCRPQNLWRPQNLCVSAIQGQQIVCLPRNWCLHHRHMSIKRELDQSTATQRQRAASGEQQTETEQELAPARMRGRHSPACRRSPRPSTGVEGGVERVRTHLVSSLKLETAPAQRSRGHRPPRAWQKQDHARWCSRPGVQCPVTDWSGNLESTVDSPLGHDGGQSGAVWRLPDCFPRG